jgi:hypothetical protein
MNDPFSAPVPWAIQTAPMRQNRTPAIPRTMTETVTDCR